MITIPFTKAHGAHNDFLLTWRDQLPSEMKDWAETAVAICARHTGAGADGWLIVTPGSGSPEHGTIELWNSDGSRSEISGNGTRCAAAFLLEATFTGENVRIATGAGLKHLRLLARAGHSYSFEMNMGAAKLQELHAKIEDRDCSLVNVGNPQCVFFVDNFDFAWQAAGARVERHERFPNRTNVSFVRVADRNTLDMRFFERGAGETMSSGTGSTGAVAAAIARNLVDSPVRVNTPAGPLRLSWVKSSDQNSEVLSSDILLAGPAEIIAKGEFFWKGNNIRESL